MRTNTNRLVLIGNGFDLAHGLKTSYKDFINWYFCKIAQAEFRKENIYQDSLLELRQNFTGSIYFWDKELVSFGEILQVFNTNKRHLSIAFPSQFFERIISSLIANKWVDIERYFFHYLKTYFSNPNVYKKEKEVAKLNKEFNFLITLLSKYIQEVNTEIRKVPKLKFPKSEYNIVRAFEKLDASEVRFLNFNYTETLLEKGYANKNDIIHIHGRAADIENNPIIFGYGDETDPVYQSIEDSGENIYLEHIKSFGYFQTGNYHELISYIDSAPFETFIIGHSCGLSDRVLLSEIFEHPNCVNIEIFYHKREDGYDNFKEITQEISRHFRPQNKNLMRRKVGDKNLKNIIPQNSQKH
ncbi:MAG TPA: AbiH family protein [Chitinophagaceae bacterium]|nr:AbiH family protein [Chitinophagaceae bacterium]